MANENRNQEDKALCYRAQGPLQELLQNEVELREMTYLESAAAFAARSARNSTKSIEQAATLGKQFGESRPGVFLMTLLSLVGVFYTLILASNPLGSFLMMCLSAVALGSLYWAVVHADPWIFVGGQAAVGLFSYKLYLIDSLSRAIALPEILPAVLAGPALMFFLLAQVNREDARSLSGGLFAIPSGLFLGMAAAFLNLFWGVLGGPTRALWWPLCRKLTYGDAERKVAERTLSQLEKEGFTPRLSVCVRYEDIRKGCRQAFVQTSQGPLLVDFRAPAPDSNRAKERAAAQAASAPLRKSINPVVWRRLGEYSR